MNQEELKQTLLDIAADYLQRGPGYAQEAVVLGEAVDRLKIGNDLAAQQDLLTAWHDLFRDGKLYWGYNVDNPSAPFYHLPRRAS